MVYDTTIHKIFIIGPDFFGYTEAIADALKRKGFCVERFMFRYNYNIVDKIINNCNIVFQRERNSCPAKSTIKRLEDELLKTVNRFQPDLLLVIKGDIFSAETYSQIDCKFKILWMYDLMSAYPDVEKIFPEFNRILFYDKVDAEDYADKGYCTGFLPDFADGNVFFKQNEVKDIDISFVGNMYANRDTILHRIVEDFPDLNIKIYGRHIRKIQVLKKVKSIFSGESRYFTNTNISLDEANRINNRSKIVLNIQREGCRYSSNMRFYEIAASGTYQIVNENGYFRENFADCCGMYNGYEELKKLIEDYLASDEQQNKQAEKLRNLVINEHTLDSRINQLCMEFEELLRNA